MPRLAAVAALPLLGAFLYAQQPVTRTETTTTKTTWNGALVDETCRVSRTQTKETKSDAKTETTTTVVTECPVTPTTTSFGFVTSDGKSFHFDAPSNSKIVQIIKANKDFNKSKVRVIGTTKGDIVVLEDIQ